MIGPKHFITISLLSEGLRSPSPILISSWREESITGSSAWIRDVKPSGSCMILSDNNGIMTEIRDDILQDFDFYQGKAPAHTPDVQSHIDLAKQESELLRDKFADFIDYIR